MDAFLDALAHLVAQGRQVSQAWTDLGEERDLALEATYPGDLPPFDDIVTRLAGWHARLTAQA